MRSCQIWGNCNWTETITTTGHMHAKSHRMWLIVKSRRYTRTHIHTHEHRIWFTKACAHTNTHSPTCWDVVERWCLQNLQRLLLSQDPLCGRERTLCFKYGPQHWDKLPATNQLISQLRPQSMWVGFRSSAQRRAHAAVLLAPPEQLSDPWPVNERAVNLQRCLAAEEL